MVMRVIADRRSLRDYALRSSKTADNRCTAISDALTAQTSASIKGKHDWKTNQVMRCIFFG